MPARVTYDVSFLRHVTSNTTYDFCMFSKFVNFVQIDLKIGTHIDWTSYGDPLRTRCEIICILFSRDIISLSLNSILVSRNSISLSRNSISPIYMLDYCALTGNN